MNPPAYDDADLDRLLAEHLDTEVRGITAGPDLLDRIKADGLAASGRRRRRRPPARWVWPIAGAAAAVLAVVFINAGTDDDIDVTTGESIDAPEARVLLSGDARGEPWSVVEYVEDDPLFVEEPTTCLRFEPPVEEGPFFCGTQEDLAGAHGRLVLRRGTRFNDHAVFAGVFAPAVAEVTLELDGRQAVVMDPTSWPGRNLGIAATMLPVPGDIGYDAVLRDVEGRVLSLGSSSGRADPDVTRSDR